MLVTQNPAVQSLSMIPSVNIIEDCQFRKALPKSYKHFESVEPFSQRLARIRDGQKFMNAISVDMLRSVALREEKFFANRIPRKKDVEPAAKPL